MQNLDNKNYASANNYGILSKGVSILSFTKSNTSFKISRAGVYEVHGSAYVSSDDVFLRILKNGREVALQRTQIVGCVSCSTIVNCAVNDKVELISTAPGFEFNYIITRINDYN